ncbi:MAG TPA: hypothetical protein VFW45_09520 [Candidatus Polarisedimenticolia bacterium]|nr:hypothetical protein [Candidatus Polarisedimenticolia bacterium]
MTGKRRAAAVIPLLALALIAAAPKSGKPRQAAAKPAAKAKPARPAEEGTWNIKVVPDTEAASKGEREFDDTLIVNRGKLKATAGVPDGFGEAPYRSEAGTIMAELSSAGKGLHHWHAEISGDAISGKMTWIRSDGTVLYYSFSGARAGAQAP